MTTEPWSKDTLHAFQEAAQSLKLYRRADILDVEKGSSLIEDLYVDPLPADHVFQTVLRPHTTFVIGRKGTGKSTVFQRLQAELRKSKHQTSAYLDIKTVYESAQIDPNLLARIQKLDAVLPPESLERLLLFKEFLRAVIGEIKSELRKRVEASFWERVKERFAGTLNELFEGLDALLDDADEDRFVSVLGIQSTEIRTKDNAAEQAAEKVGFGADVGPNAKLTASADSSRQVSAAHEHETTVKDILVRSFDLKEFIDRLRGILESLGIRNLYILVDDFSELPEDAMRVVVDVLLAPLNNRSEEFIKFKIAAYPGRIHFGEIDKTKIDEVYLDMYRLYGGGDVARMEDSAIDFTKRLMERRIAHYCNVDPVEFLAAEEDVWRQLFFASMANPRSLGYILHYVYESSLIRGKRIGVSAIQEAAQRYFEEKIESYFSIGKFLHETFEERSSIYSLKELLESIVSRARELRTHDSEVMRKIRGRPPTSHFHVPVDYEPLFSTLELNFFLTKYFEMTDRSGRKVSVFALNFGLCSKYTIRFGRPTGEREFRLYFVERVFDYTPLVAAYLARNQEIVCGNCGEKYSYDHLSALKMFGMLCPKCRSGTVSVTNLSQKYAAEIRAVDDNLLLPAIELGMLQTLHTERTPLKASVIAGELDCSYQLVGKRGKALSERGLVKRLMTERGRLFQIEPMAEAAYFSDRSQDDLQIQSDAPRSGE